MIVTSTWWRSEVRETIEMVDRHHKALFRAQLGTLDREAFPFSRRTYYNWMNGMRDPRARDVLTLCEVYRISPVSFAQNEIVTHEGVAAHTMTDWLSYWLTDIIATTVVVQNVNRTMTTALAVNPGTAAVRAGVSYARVYRAKAGELGRWLSLLRIASLGYGMLPVDYLRGGRLTEGVETRSRIADALMLTVGPWIEGLDALQNFDVG